MIKVTILTFVLIFASMLGGCGGSNKAKETLRSEANVSTSNSNMKTANTTAARKDGHADDAAVNRPASNSNISDAGSKPRDRDDVRKSGNSNVSRKDADDKGKQDSDRDDDDR